MGVIGLARRLWYRWSWRLRYWWLDTPAGRVAQLSACALACLAVILVLTRQMILVSSRAPVADEPVQALAWWVVQVVVMVVAAAITAMRAPRVEEPKPQEVQAPTVEDGLAVREVYGTVWIDNEFLLAWKGMGRDKIQKKGGKK